MQPTHSPQVTCHMLQADMKGISLHSGCDTINKDLNFHSVSPILIRKKNSLHSVIPLSVYTHTHTHTHHCCSILKIIELARLIVKNFLYIRNCLYIYGLPGSSDSKESAWKARDLSLIPGFWRYPEEGNGNPLQYPCLENYSILAWRIPWTEEPGGLQPMGSQRASHKWVTNIFTFHFHTHTNTHVSQINKYNSLVW